MVPNSSDFENGVTGSANRCGIDKPLGPPDTTTRSLLNALKGKLQKEQEVNPSWDSTDKLKVALESLEKEYSSIPETVKTYKNGYESIKTKLKGYKDYENKLKSMINDDEYQDIRTAIDKLWKESYSETEIYKQYKQASDSFKEIKNCFQIAEAELSTLPQDDKTPPQNDKKETKPPTSPPSPDPVEALIPDKKIRGAREEFFYLKDYNNKIENVFKVLDALKRDLENVDDGNIRKKYAYYLVFKEVLDIMRSVSPDDSEQQKSVSGKYQKKVIHDDEWLKDELIKKFKEWVNSVYKYFYWHKDWVAKREAVGKAWTNYEEFLKNRKPQFISEVEEVEAQKVDPESAC